MKKLTIISGDPSSDGYAYEIASALLQQDKTWVIDGVGGPKLRSIAPLVLDQSPICIVGLVEIFKNLVSILRLRRKCLKKLAVAEPHTVLLLDCPGFNMSLLPKLSTKHRIVYAIPPQVWAWHESRVEKLKQYCHEVWVIYPFEVSFYQGHGLSTRLLKHPLIDKPHLASRRLLPSQSVMKIALLPGSRGSEHQYLMPYYLQLVNNHPEIDWVWVEHRAGSLAKWHHVMKGSVVEGLSALPEVHGAIAASGTVTLELALMNIPSIVIYKVSALTAMIARYLVKIKWVSLPNILLQKMIYPELIQDDLNDSSLELQLKMMLTENCRLQQYEQLQAVRLKLDSTSATLTDCMMNLLSACD